MKAIAINVKSEVSNNVCLEKINMYGSGIGHNCWETACVMGV